MSNAFDRSKHIAIAISPLSRFCRRVSVKEGPQHAVSKLACCVVLCQIVSLPYVPRSSLHRLAGLPCLFLSYGLQVVTREVHRPSLRWSICPAHDHFIFLRLLIISMTFALSLTQMLGFLSLYVMLSILRSSLVCAAASLFCAYLVSVQVSAPCNNRQHTGVVHLSLQAVLAAFLPIFSTCSH